MLALGITRFAVGLLLMAVAFGLAGQAASAGVPEEQTTVAQIACGGSGFLDSGIS
jgi:hypothetical protein